MMNQYSKAISSFKMILLVVIFLTLSSCRYIASDPQNHIIDEFNSIANESETTSSQQPDITNTPVIFSNITEDIILSDVEPRNELSSENMIIVDDDIATISLCEPLNESDMIKLKDISTITVLLSEPIDISLLCGCDSLNTLRINYFIEDDLYDITNLTDIVCSNIETVIIDGGGCQIRLEQKAISDNLQEFHLLNTSLFISEQHNFPSLKTLTATDVTFIYDNPFSKFSNVESLYLRNCKFTDNSINCLSACLNVKELSIIDCDFSIIEEFKCFSQLLSLFLYSGNLENGYNIHSLEGMDSILEIKYGDNLFNDEDINLLKYWYPNTEIKAICGI